MPVIRCSECNTGCRVSEAHAGKKVKCPKCGQVLVVPSAASAEPEEDAASKPSPKRDRSSPEPKSEKPAAKRRDEDSSPKHGKRKRDEAKAKGSGFSPRKLALAIGLPATAVVLIVVAVVVFRGGSDGDKKQIAAINPPTTAPAETKAPVTPGETRSADADPARDPAKSNADPDKPATPDPAITPLPQPVKKDAPSEVTRQDSSDTLFDFLKGKASATSRMSGQQIYDKLLKSTVCIISEGGQGSGALVSAKDRLVITNYHVVQGGSAEKVSAMAKPIRIKSQLDESSPPDRIRGTRCKIFLFQMLQGEKFSIDMKSTEFDPFLRLEDSQGNRVAENDDISKENLDARIVFTAPADDKYRIVATSFDNGAGNFLLIISPVEFREQPNREKIGESQTVLVFFPKFQGGSLVTDAKSYVKDIVADKEKYKGKVLYADQAKDLAIVQLSQLPEGVEALPLAKDSARPGQGVHSVGNPGASSSFWVYTSGSVRTNPYQKQWVSVGAGRMFKHDVKIIETQSPTNPGDSGGPLVNEAGELVAVTQGAVLDANALNLFVDVSEVKNVLQGKGFAWHEGSGQGGIQVEYNITSIEIQKLAGLLQHSNSTVRNRAALILGEVGPRASESVSALCKSLKDTTPEVRRAAAQALGNIGQGAASSMSDLGAALNDSDRLVRLQALRAVRQIGPRGPALSTPLAGIVNESDPELQEAALLVLGKLGPDAESALPALKKLLDGNERKLRLLAFDVIEQIGPAAKQTSSSMQKLIETSDTATRTRIIRLLSSWNKLSDAASAVLPDLIKGVQGENRDARIESLKTLELLGKDAKPAVSAVESIYKNGKDSPLRLQALKTLSAMGPAAESAVPILILDLKDQGLRKNDNAVYDQVASTLVKIGKPAVKPLLKIALYDPLPFYRLKATYILGEMGRDAKEALAPLEIALRSREQDPQVRAVLTTTIEKLK